MNIRSSMTALVAILALTALPLSAAQAAAGTLTDPKGDGYPDIVKLTYANKAKSVGVSMTYDDIGLAQNESFLLRWKAGKHYQVFVSTSGIQELRYYSSKSAPGKVVACAGLKVKHTASKDKTKVTIPRSCLSKAPDKLKFQGVATMGLSFSDKTKISPKVALG
jgi:hypothetical protein